MTCYNCNRKAHFSWDCHVPVKESTRNQQSSSAPKDTGNQNLYENKRSGGYNKAYVAIQRRKFRINDGGRATVSTTNLDDMPDIVIDIEASEHVFMDPG